MEGKAIIFSAPSGSGKTTIVNQLLLNNPDLSFSISATSRKIRSNEINGKDYYFISEGEFKQKIQHEEFVEWEEVYDGTYYGTLRSEIDRIWSDGKAVVFDVEVKGGIKLKKYFGDNAIAIFIRVKSMDVLRERLKKRKSESSESLKRRLDKAEYEMTFQHKFDRIIINDDLKEAVREAELLINEFLKP